MTRTLKTMLFFQLSMYFFLLSIGCLEGLVQRFYCASYMQHNREGMIFVLLLSFVIWLISAKLLHLQFGLLKVKGSIELAVNLALFMCVIGFLIGM